MEGKEKGREERRRWGEKKTLFGGSLVQKCSTSFPGGDQVDGLPPAPNLIAVF